MNKVRTYNTLEKFMCFAHSQLIQELVIADLHENLSILSKTNEYQSLLAEYQFEQGEANELLNMQIVDSTNHQLGLLGYRQDCLIIIIGKKVEEEIFESCTKEEKHIFFNLVKDYICVNMEKEKGKYEQQKIKQKIFPHYPSSYSMN